MKRVGKCIICASLLAASMSTSAFAQAGSGAGSGSGQGSAKSDEGSANADDGDCPDFMRGSKLRISETDYGVNVRVTTDEQSNVPRLRDLVGDVTDTVERVSHVAHRQAEPSQVSPQDIPYVDMTTKDIAEGAEVQVRAKDPRKVADVHEQAKVMKEAWDHSSCVKPQTATREKHKATSTKKTPSIPIERTHAVDGATY